MNTTPDETKLAMWLDDELTGKDLAEMEAWAANEPEQIAAREELRNYKSLIAEIIPASEEPPYPDFFVTRVNQGIRELEAEPKSTPALVKQSSGSRFWKSWLMPAAACAGMILAFSIGRQSGDTSPAAATVENTARETTPLVYTPEDGVDAEWVSNQNSMATVIVLSGVSAIPDSTDFSETVYVPTASEADRTASSAPKPSNQETQ